MFPQDTRPATLLHTIVEHDVTTFFAPPTMIQMLVDAARGVNMPASTLRNVIYGGAPMRLNRIVDAQDAFGPVIHATYGQTEAPQIITYLSAAALTDPPASPAGRASLMTEVAITDADGGCRRVSWRSGRARRPGRLHLGCPTRRRRPSSTAGCTPVTGVPDERGYLFRATARARSSRAGSTPIRRRRNRARAPSHRRRPRRVRTDDHWARPFTRLEPKPGATVDVNDHRLLKRELGAVKSPKVCMSMNRAEERRRKSLEDQSARRRHDGPSPAAELNRRSAS